VDEENAMTIASRQMARRCREWFATHPTDLPSTAETTDVAPEPTTQPDAAAEATQENVDAAK
jgi:hypothetical protein